jgi:UDP-glucose 4-epimerase
MAGNAGWTSTGPPCIRTLALTFGAREYGLGEGINKVTSHSPQRQSQSRPNVLVCGGAGYIGSHVVRVLMDQGHVPVIVDDLSAGHVESVPQGVALIRGSIGDRGCLDEVFSEYSIDCVMHLCAYAYVGESVENPAKYYRNNIANGLVLLDAMRAHDVPRLIFSSSCTVYGMPERLPLDEQCRLRPMSPYGWTKMLFEQILSDYHAAYGLQYVALRYFNAAGAMPERPIGEDHEPETHLIPLVLRQGIDEAATITILGDDYNTPDGSCVRDYIHVADLADAHCRAMRYLQDGGESVAMNLANQRGYSVKEIIAASEKVIGRPLKHHIGPRRPGDPPTLIGNAALAAELLGWSPVHSDIEQILTSAWHWHQSHPAGYRSADTS